MSVKAKRPPSRRRVRRRKTCLRGGCRRCPRHPHGFCTTHSPRRSQRIGKISAKPKTQSSQKNKADDDLLLEEGVLKPFTLNKNLTRSILKLTKPWIPKVIDMLPRTSTVTGQRNLICPKECEFIDKSEIVSCEKLVQEATDEIVSGMEGFAGAKACSVKLVLAPSKSNKSNGWTNGPIHRDIEMYSFCDVLTATMALGDVSQHNGSIRFWKKSTMVPFKSNGKHNNRILDKLGAPETLVAKEGSVMVWDSRMLHQSLANQCDQMTVKINWFIESAAFRREHEQLIVQA